MTADGELKHNNLDQVPTRHASLDMDYNVQDTITSLKGVVLNLGQTQADSRKPICPDGGHLVSIMYIVLICILGISFPVREALQQVWLTTYVEAVFLAYLYGVSCLFLVFVEIYLIQQQGEEARKDKDKPKILVKDKKSDTQNVYDTVNGKFESVNNAALARRRQSMLSTVGVEIFILEQASEYEEPHPHHTSLYVRFGSIIFGLGNMVYDGLLLKKIQKNMGMDSPGCLDAHFIWPQYIHLAFLLLQTFFIFKHPQVKIATAKPLARMGFMHIFATNICVWIRTVIRETLEGFLLHSSHGDDHGSDDHGSDSTYGSYDSSYKTTTYNVTEYGSTNSTDEYHASCDLGDDILTKASPYLFPCVLEYSLLAAAVMFSMYADVGTHSKGSQDEVAPGDAMAKSQEEDMHQKSFITEINFHRSHKGMFAGIMVIAAGMVSIVLFFSYADQHDDIYHLIYHITMIGLYALILCGTIVAALQLQALKFNPLLTSSVDDVMLVAAMGGLILFQVLKLIPLVNFMATSEYTEQNVLQLTESWLAAVAVFLHTWFLIDGMRRMSSTEDQYFRKPGRGAVMFLLLTNIALWLYRTFHMKEIELESKLQEYEYGYLAWQLIMHALVPLLIFYHFHCSACLAHIWSSSYVPLPEKPEQMNTSRFHNDNKSIEAMTPSRHGSEGDLIPDRIVQFQRHGRAPEARRPSLKTVVQNVKSPLDGGRSETWPRLDVGEGTGNGAPTTGTFAPESQGDSTPSVVWQKPRDYVDEKNVKWQIQTSDDDEVTAA